MRASSPSPVRSFLFACAVLLGLHASAQNFSGFSYQAVVRDNLGDPVANQPVGVQVTIQVGATGSYVETHSATTDAFGLIALTIGQGTPVGGSAIPSFAAVPWDSGLPIAYSVAVDVTGGTNYTFLGGGPFNAVPFAMHALTSDSTAASAPQTLALSNDTLYISNGNSVDLSGLADQPGWVLSGDTLHNDGKRVGIGTTTPDTTLHVVGGIQYQDGGQATGKLLTSDAQGNASWQALSPESIFGSGNVPGGSAICLNSLATIATGSQPVSVAVSGSHAYVVDQNSNTMRVFNISDPAAPTLTATIGTGSAPGSVAISGSHAYVVNFASATMQVFNISDPAAPTLSATIATGLWPFSVAVSGSHAYVVNNGSYNMMVFNISDPAAPTLSATIATGLWPVSVAVSGSHAYVVNSSSYNMMVFNISDPAAPTLSATIATGSGPWSVAVSGSHAYVVNTSSNSMQVFNISDPAAPTLTATIATGWGPTAVAVSGSHAYLVHSGSNSMMVYNISNPAAPSLSATIATGSAPWSVAVSGSNAYVMNRYDNTMQVFNLFCPPNMVTIDPVTGEFTTQPLTGLTQNGSAAGNTPYWNGTQWVTNSSNIFNNGGNVGMGTNTPANRLDVEGGLAVGGSYSGSTAAPANGAIIEGNVGMGTTTPANRLDVEGGLAVGNAYSGSTVAPANGAIIEGNVGMGTTTPANRLDVEGGLAVGSSYSGSTVAPANGAIIEGNVGIGTTTPANKLDVEGRLAVGSSYSGSTVAPANGAIIEGNVGIGTATPAAKLDVAGTVKIADGTQGTGKLLTSDAQGNASWQALSPESIFGSGSVPGGAICLNSLATVATGWGPLSVAFSGNNAYVVSQYSNSMQVFNISDPAAPTLSATIATGSTPWSVAISGSQAYVVNYGSSNMMVFNISNPAAPTLSATIATGSGPASVAVSGSNAYVVNYNSATMQVFNISNPAVPTLSATIATGSQPRSLAVSGSHAYVVNQSSSTMQVFNISNPAAPTLSATIATGPDPQSVAVSGSNAYVVNYNSATMQVFNISDPAAPTLSATIATGSEPFSVAVSGSHACVVNNGSNNMQVFNISNPAAPTLSATIATGSNPQSVAVSGSHAFVVNATSNTMQVFNLFCPPNMVTIDPVTGEFTAQQLAGLTQNGSAAGNTPYWNGTQWVANSSNIFNNGGNVGIGTTNPIAPLHVVPNGSNSYSSLPITFFNYGSVLQNINWVPVTMAGYFQGNLMVTQAVMTTNGALTVSDRRLKKIVGRTDTEEDLAVLDRIQVTDYTFIDSITQGNSVQKKVIAQELEEVYPNAIRYNQDHIPDIYSLSSAVRSAEGKLVVTLAKPHGLVQGDQLKWIEENGTEHFDSVSCVIDAHTFELPSAEPRSRIFVWGRKVNDLRTVDYDAVTMLNVSATQALHKLVRALQERNEALEQRNSLLDAELEGMRAQLEANTALMLKLQSVLDAQTRK